MRLHTTAMPAAAAFLLAMNHAAMAASSCDGVYRGTGYAAQAGDTVEGPMEITITDGQVKGWRVAPNTRQKYQITGTAGPDCTVDLIVEISAGRFPTHGNPTNGKGNAPNGRRFYYELTKQ